MSTAYQPVQRQFYDHPLFNDLRLAKRYHLFQQSIDSHQSSIVNRVAGDEAERKAFYRFLANSSVGVSELLGEALRNSAWSTALAGKHLLVVGDSTEISLKKQIGYLKDADQVGVLSDNKTPGFLAHVNMALDAQSGHGLGISDVLLWSRPKSKGSKTAERSYQDKESYKWELGVRNSEIFVQQAQAVTYVFDQESDIFDLWRNLCTMEPQRDFISRIHYNRKVQVGKLSEKLSQVLNPVEWCGTYTIKIRTAKRKNRSRRKEQQRQARQARMQVRYTPVQLMPPQADRNTQQALDLWVVEAVESPESVPEGEKPIHWRLLTSHPIQGVEDALRIVRWYEKRWMIEQLFRLLKRQGFQIEDSEIRSYESILKLLVMSIVSAFKVLQLVLARDQDDGQCMEEVFTQQQQQCLLLLNEQYQGGTQKQKNPYPPDQVSWASWVIARLGGWKGYQSQQPPGPITMKRGLEKFNTFFEAWTIFNKKDVYKP